MCEWQVKRRLKHLVEFIRPFIEILNPVTCFLDANCNLGQLIRIKSGLKKTIHESPTTALLTKRLAFYLPFF